MLLKDLFTLPLALEFTSDTTASQPHFPLPLVADLADRPVLNWRRWLSKDGEESWITRWAQDGLLLSAKAEAMDIVDPAAEEHLWRYSVTVHVYDANDEQIALVTLDDVQAPLMDLDIYAVLDEAVFLAGDRCVAFVRGQSQPETLH